MALGTETAAALAEVKAAIDAETDQAAAAIIDRVGADAETAAAIRGLLAPVKGIVPDAPAADETAAPPAADDTVAPPASDAAETDAGGVSTE